MAITPVTFQVEINNSKEAFHANIAGNSNSYPNIPRLKLKRAIVFAGGPSGASYLEEIKRLQTAGYDVFAINGACRFLLANGITPDFGILYDSRPQNREFLVGSLGKNIHWLVASHCDSSVFSDLTSAEPDPEMVSMFHSSGHTGSAEVIANIEPGSHILSGGLTGGLQALNLLTVLGYRIARLYGYDSSTSAGDRHSYPQPMNAGEEIVEYWFNDVAYRTTHAMAAQADAFIRDYTLYVGQGIDLTVHGVGLLPDMWAHAERQRLGMDGDTDEAREAGKYVHMWRDGRYRISSPGERLVEYFLQRVAPEPGASIVDFGCGSGRAAHFMQQKGFDVLGVDHAHNCLDKGLMINLCIANLWKLPTDVEGDYGYCTDVMEHIPEKYVEAVLTNIAAAVKKSCYFRIAFDEDHMGDMITGPLHLTIKDYEWWNERLAAHFQGVVGDKSRGTFWALKAQ